VIFYTPFHSEVPRQNIAIPFSVEILQWWGYPILKNFEEMYNRLDSIPACDRQTDGRTDGQTDILLRHSPRYAYASRGKNVTNFMKRKYGGHFERRAFIWRRNMPHHSYIAVHARK